MDKDYFLPEEKADSLNEYLLEYQKKNEVSLKKKAPCQFNAEQLRRELELSERDIREGKVYTTEELRKRHPLC